MSLSQRIKQGFLRMPRLDKTLLVSSLVLFVSPLLPWYDNRNAFGSGETYLGVQGPLFLIGFLVMGLGAVAFLQMFLPLMGRNFFKIRRNGGIAMLVAAQSLLLVLISNSIFFHPAFGANISNKGTRFGLFFAFMSIGLMLAAGYFSYRKMKKAGAEMHEDEVDDLEDAFVPATPSYSSPSSPAYSTPSTFSTPSSPSYSSPSMPTYGSPSTSANMSGVDPLTLDARTRYKMMSQNARTNLWQRPKSDAAERETADDYNRD